MSALCLMVAEQSLRLSGIILFLWVLRALLRRIPGSALYLLWILVFTGLLLPFRVEIPYYTDVYKRQSAAWRAGRRNISGSCPAVRPIFWLWPVRCPSAPTC